MTQTPKPLISTVEASRTARPVSPAVVTAKKAPAYGSNFFLQATFEILDRNDSESVEFHKSFQARTGLRPKQGMFIPLDKIFGRSWKRDLATSNTTFVQTDVDADIRPSFVFSPICKRATVFTDLQGNFRKPYFATSVTPLANPTEGSTVSDNSNQTFGALTMSPAALAFSVLVSRQAVVQSQADLISAAFKDVRRVAESNLDGFALGAINAVGNIPSKGILTSSVNPSSGNADFSKTNFYTTDMSSAITNVKLSSAVANVEATAANDDGTFLFVTSPTGASTLRTTSIGSADTRFLVENNRVLGDDRLPLATSQYLSGVTGNLIFGRFSDLALAIWGFEMAVDPYTQMTNDNIVLNCVLWCNVGLLHGPSFVVGANGNL
jgi:HK97 family phage major capsid protein